MRPNLAGVPLPFTKSWLTELCALKEILILLRDGQGQLRIGGETSPKCLTSKMTPCLAVSVSASIS